jgi:hypothetical protein
MNFEELQRQEVEALTLIYGSHVKVLRGQYPYKVQIEIHPFLEESNLVLPSGYPNLFISIIIEMGEQYPRNKPIISFFSNRKAFMMRPFMKNLQLEYNNNFENKKQDLIILEIVEQIRELLYQEVKSSFKQFSRIRHFMEPEKDDILDMHLDDIEVHENLTKKATCTPLTIENFNAWNAIYLKEVKAKKKQEMRKVINMKKPTGREIFMDTANILFVDDDDGEDDEEEDENLNVDEDVFDDDDDDDLDGLDL